MSQYDDVECTLTMCILHNATKQKYDYLDAVNRIKIHLKTRHHAILASKFTVEYTIERLLSVL